MSPLCLHTLPCFFITLAFKVEVLASLQKPKKITANASDGKSYILLCKPKVCICMQHMYVHSVIESILLLSRTTLEKMHDWWNSTPWSTRFSVLLCAIFCMYICMQGCDVCISLILPHNACNTQCLRKHPDCRQRRLHIRTYVCTHLWNMSFVRYKIPFCCRL